MASVTFSPTEREREISRALVGARKAALGLPSFPGPLPGSIEGAYRVQAISREAWGDEIVGWKVGGIPPQHREHCGATHLSGPIFSRRLVHCSGTGSVPMPVFAEGFAAIEPEFVLRLGDTREADSLFIGAEIASSPLIAINDIGPIAVICDFGNNNGLLVGPEIADWATLGGEEFVVETLIAGKSVGRRAFDDIPSMVACARDFLFDLAEREDIALGAGTLVSTGAITGVHEAGVGDRSILKFGKLGELELELVAEEAEP